MRMTILKKRKFNLTLMMLCFAVHCDNVQIEQLKFSQLFALGLGLKDVKKYTKEHTFFLAQTTAREIERNRFS